MEVRNNIKNILLWVWHVFGIMLSSYIASCVFVFVVFLVTNVDFFKIPAFLEQEYFLFGLFLFLFMIFVAPLFIGYLINKLFGTFKFLDNKIKNKIFKILVLFFLSMFSVLCLKKPFDNTIYSVDIPVFYFVSLPIFSYLLYKFFNFLTLKFPKTFEKIGYYSSLKCYKRILRKIVKKLKEKYGKK